MGDGLSCFVRSVWLLMACVGIAGCPGATVLDGDAGLLDAGVDARDAADPSDGGGDARELDAPSELDAPMAADAPLELDAPSEPDAPSELDAGPDAPIGVDAFVAPDAPAELDAGSDAGTDAPVLACGDGVRAPTESCDPGIPAGSPGACPPGCTDCTCGRLVFMTSEQHTGALGGLAGADAICNRLAAAASLPGTYRAWLSTTAGSPSTRFTRSTEPYFTTLGGVVAADWAGLVDGALDRAINVTELGVTIVVATGIYTATNAAGAHITPDCAGWTDGTTARMGRRGNASFYTDYLWTDHSDGECAVEVYLFCVQQ